MSRGRGLFERPDLIYRKLTQQHLAAAEETPDADWALLDGITDKVMEYLNATEIAKWTDDQWSAYKTLLTHRLKKPSSSTPVPTHQLTTAQLLDLTNSDDDLTC